MFDKHQLRTLVTDTLAQFTDWFMNSDAAVNLVLGTIAQESAMGKYRRQLGNGPARGICQMEPATEKDIWQNFLRYKITLRNRLSSISGVYGSDPKKLETNDQYAILMCRVHYLRVREPLPEAGDVNSLARYWKLHYNTPLGKGTAKEFVENYKRYLL